MKPIRILLRASTGFIPGPATILYGRTAGHSSGTTFDYHVNNSTGNDTTGTGALASPYATPTKALAVAVAAGGNKKIALHDTGTPYTDIPPTVTTNGIEFHGYDTDFVPWYGGYKVTGWTACVSGDSAVVGSAWTNCYKATFAKSNIAHAAYNALLPLENGTPLNLAQKRRDVTDLFFQDNTGTFYDSVKGDSVTMGVDGSGHPTTITHAAVLGSYTDAQITRAAAVLIWGDANQSDYIPISSVSSGVITLAANSFARQIDGDGTHSAYNLLNIGPEIQQGQYVYDASDATNLTLYVWPNDAAHLADGIWIAAKKNILTFQLCSNCKVSNIDFRLTANDDTSAVAAVVFDRTTSCEFKHNGVRFTSHQYRSGYGPLYVQGGTGNVLQNNDIEHAQNMFGPVLSLGAYTATGNRLLNNYVYRAALSPWRCLGQVLSLVADNWLDSSGLGAHANKGNFYQGGDQAVAWRNKWTNCGGYLTCQASSRMVFGMNYDPSDPTGDTADAFIDQTGSVTPPTNPSDNYIINNLMPQAGGNTGSGPGIDLSPVTGATVNWGVANNVTKSLLDMGTNRVAGYPDGNVYLDSSATGIGVSDTVISGTQDAVFYDYTTDNYNAVPSSVLLTKSGVDVTAVVEMIEGWFPDFNFRMTLNGYGWDPADPGEGCYGKHWPLQADTTVPTLSSLSATITGGSASCTVSTDKRGGMISWVRYNGGSTPSAAQVIAGEDSTGSAALSSGSFAVDGTGTQGPFTVTGTAGETDTLAVVQEDRYGNISTVVTTSLAFAAFTPQWVAFDGVHWLHHAAALTGAQATTRNMLFAFTIKKTAAEIAAGSTTAGGVLTISPSSGSHTLSFITVSGSGRVRAQLRQTGTTTLLMDKQAPSTGGVVADTEYLVLVSYHSVSAGSYTGRVRLIKVVDGTLPANQPTDSTGADALVSVAGATTLFDVFKCQAGVTTGTFERFMLWDNPSLTPDAADSTIQQLFVGASGGLKDPSVAVASLGTPLVSLYGNALVDGNAAEGHNAGSGGDFTLS